MERTYKIRVLNIEETEDIYMGPAVRHFPANERKPMKAIRRMYGEGCYETLGLFDGEKLAAYALFVVSPGGDHLLLDYYAVLEEYRGSGVGSLFLQRMRQWYGDRQGILLETEDVLLAADEKERSTRLRRNAFYLRNGVRETQIRASYCGADYQVFYMPIREEKSEQEIRDGLEQIYRIMLLDKYEEWVVMHLTSPEA